MHALFTGSIEGTVTTADGVVVDVTPRVIMLPTLEEVAEVADLIGQRYAAEGHPEHTEDDPFVYEPISQEG